MLYMFECRNDEDEESYIVPIEADNMDLAWGIFNTFHEGEWDHVRLSMGDN